MSPALMTRGTARTALVGDAVALLESGHRLAAVVCRGDGAGFLLRYCFLPSRVDPQHPPVELTVAVPADDPTVPSLAAVSFPAGRFEREIADLYGVQPAGHPQPKRLVAHAHWPVDWAPMRGEPVPEFDPDVAGFPFADVSGTGVYEIAVGPVHAGIIEPGHFRFSVVGETIVRMEPRLWFLHRGVEKAFEGRRPAEGVVLAEHIAGDAVIGHTLAYVLAVESALGIEVPEEERMLRALLLELERLANHVTDLGALANDTGFGLGNAHALRLRERLLRVNDSVAGHRLLRGTVTVGGAHVRSLPGLAELDEIAGEVAELAAVVRAHGVVRDRLTGTGRLPSPAAAALGTLGYVARASGLDADARRDVPFIDLGEGFEVCVETGGDVLARFRVREREFAISARLVHDLAARLSEPRHPKPWAEPQSLTDEGAASRLTDPGRAAATQADGNAGDSFRGLGIVESWRGALLHHVEVDGRGLLARVKVVDPSFFNWPALPIALADTIVPDFPLTNKSFNQSYAGNDL